MWYGEGTNCWFWTQNYHGPSFIVGVYQSSVISCRSASDSHCRPFLPPGNCCCRLQLWEIVGKLWTTCLPHFLVENLKHVFLIFLLITSGKTKHILQIILEQITAKIESNISYDGLPPENFFGTDCVAFGKIILIHYICHFSPQTKFWAQYFST